MKAASGRGPAGQAASAALVEGLSRELGIVTFHTVRLRRSSARICMPHIACCARARCGAVGSPDHVPAALPLLYPPHPPWTSALQTCDVLTPFPMNGETPSPTHNARLRFHVYKHRARQRARSLTSGRIPTPVSQAAAMQCVPMDRNETAAQR